MAKHKPTGIAKWPADERPRERLLARGAHALTDAELLAILLRIGVAGKSALELGHDLLKQQGSTTSNTRGARVNTCGVVGSAQISVSS